MQFLQIVMCEYNVNRMSLKDWCKKCCVKDFTINWNLQLDNWTSSHIVHTSARPPSSSWWRTRSMALLYCRHVAKYPYFLPSSMPHGPQSSEAEHSQLFSVRWLVDNQRVSSNLLVVLEQRQWHGDDIPQGPSEPGVGVRRTSGGGTSPYRRLASTRWYSGLSHW